MGQDGIGNNRKWMENKKMEDRIKLLVVPTSLSESINVFCHWILCSHVLNLMIQLVRPKLIIICYVKSLLSSKDHFFLPPLFSN